MNTQTADTSVRHSIVVEASIERAFEVFTEDFGKFKPREHNLLAVPIAETVFEPRVGGHIY
ncbi:MAG: ATPase, partial [Mesorhizobium sp.]